MGLSAIERANVIQTAIAQEQAAIERERQRKIAVADLFKRYPRAA